MIKTHVYMLGSYVSFRMRLSGGLGVVKSGGVAAAAARADTVFAAGTIVDTVQEADAYKLISVGWSGIEKELRTVVGNTGVLRSGGVRSGRDGSLGGRVAAAAARADAVAAARAVVLAVQEADAIIRHAGVASSRLSSADGLGVAAAGAGADAVTAASAVVDAVEEADACGRCFVR